MEQVKVCCELCGTDIIGGRYIVVGTGLVGRVPGGEFEVDDLGLELPFAFVHVPCILERMAFGGSVPKLIRRVMEQIDRSTFVTQAIPGLRRVQ